MEWSTACLDWRERIVAGDSLVPIAPLFQASADEALGVFKALQVTDLPQKLDGTWPTLGEVCDNWVFDFVGAIFGAQDPQTGARLISEFMLLISKKNGKSMIAAGIMLTALILNYRHNAELLILAPTLEIANNSFDPAAGMVRADPELSELLHVIEHQRTIKHRVTEAELKVVAADSGVVGGKKAGFVLVEELWLFGKNPKAEAMLREATGGLATRSEGFLISITTHSDEAPAGVFKAKLNYFRDVRDGVIADATCLGVLYEWPKDLLEAQAYEDPDNWYITNPSLGSAVTREWLEKEYAKTLAGEGEGKQIFLAKHINVEIGLRLRRDRWGAADYWEAAEEPGLTIDALLARCEVAVVGIDGGGRDDLFGLAVAGRERDTGVWLVCCRAWALQIALERRKDIVTDLRRFEAEGTLRLVETGQALVEDVAALTVRIRDSGLMPAVGGVGVDAWGMGALVDALVAAGFDQGDAVARRAGQIAPVRQGVGLTGTIKTTEFKLGDGMLRHDGSALMAWCVSNARAELKGSNVYISKQMAGAGKIDPLIAMLNAVQMLEVGPVADSDGPSVYEERGLLVV
ncbi:phage terminase large subunit-like protein [Novosphingobium kunmingense]|uniref:Phage terminase large subunit-like protein n=1 Tax=Novosphingobium kunmingense TaxID=1211806 RepID=A0A2N0HL84_9SPHN|nr:terminase TerL endonuclease subunit [Novosphingobium kunmingense]PKB19648.1 phage terminase large subunit-like protein [Novosphingobium kunmingense]